MKFWIARNSEIPVRVQLVTQITLGIASGELSHGMRLPSRREIAIRFGVHPNTVSHAYRQLIDKGFVEFKPGSGYFVREPDAVFRQTALDQLVEAFFREAAAAGFSATEARERVVRFTEAPRPNRVCVIEDDRGLREIITAELKSELDIDAIGCGFDELDSFVTDTKTMFVAIFDEKLRLAEHLPESRCFFLKTNSPAAAMKGATRPDEDSIIAVVSGWQKFLELARVLLVAARIDPDSLLIRQTSESGWQHGLKAASIIICDSLTASMLPPSPSVRSFHVIAPESINELSARL